LTLNLMQQDVNTGIAHEMFMHGVDPNIYDWGWGARPGVGANPPSLSGWEAPTWVPWGHAATERDNPPGTHNWRLAIRAIYHAERRSGNWSWTGTQITDYGYIDGAMYLDYATNVNEPADERTSNGYLEILYPDAGGMFHFYPTFRTDINPSGAEHRVVLIKAQLTLDDGGGSDDRSTADVTLLAGGDYWKNSWIDWQEGVYNNDDFWIGRARKPALSPDASWHTCHTMTADADIEEFIAWADSEGILD
jgi:hypothetical protein